MTVISPELQKLASNIGVETPEVEALGAYLNFLSTNLPWDAGNALRVCAITHWFNLDLVAWMRDEELTPSSKTREIFDQLIRLTFVMPFHSLGYAYHEDVRAFFLDWWQKENAKTYLQLNEKALGYFVEKMKQETNNLPIYQEEIEYHLAAFGTSSLDLAFRNTELVLTYIVNAIRTHGLGMKEETAEREAAYRIYLILKRNVESRRVNRLAQQIPNIDRQTFFREYIDRVTSIYLKEHLFVDALAAGNEKAWLELDRRLKRSIRGMLWRISISDQIMAERIDEIAEESTQEALEILFKSTYPYDVSFDAWSSRIARNVLLSRYARAKDVVDRQIYSGFARSLDAEWVEDDEGSGDRFEKRFVTPLLEDDFASIIQDQEEILQAIAQLKSPIQQLVIIASFFQQLSDHEIAQMLGKTLNAVQVLRYRALIRLRHILKETSQ